MLRFPFYNEVKWANSASGAEKKGKSRYSGKMKVGLRLTERSLQKANWGQRNKKMAARIAMSIIIPIPPWVSRCCKRPFQKKM